MSATQLLDRQFLTMRAKILELAADVDRLDRAGELADDNPCWQKLQEAVRVLLDESPDRASRVQQIFSREYDPQWKSAMKMPSQS